MCKRTVENHFYIVKSHKMHKISPKMKNPGQPKNRPKNPDFRARPEKWARKKDFLPDYFKILRGEVDRFRGPPG